MGQTCISATLAAGTPPMSTMGKPATIVPPWAVISPILAAGLPIVIYRGEPIIVWIPKKVFFLKSQY
jgi:hypothetical protein